MNLEDKLYTSTEVAAILGVSLRSVYRYLEDGKLVAEVKTATGRLRFTRQNILDFLKPESSGVTVTSAETASVEASASQPEDDPVAVAPVAPASHPGSEASTTLPIQEDLSSVEPTVAEEPSPAKPVTEEVDWLSRFRSSAEKYRQNTQNGDASAQPVQEQIVEQPVEAVKEKVEVADTISTTLEKEVVEEVVEPVAEETPSADTSFYFYRSLIGGLKDIAQNIDKVARKSDTVYAFTQNAGMSLYKPLKEPFSVLHVYVNPNDRPLFERMLRLVPSDETEAQLCLLISSDPSLYSGRVEQHGLFVVSKDQLEKDLVSAGKTSLVDELKEIE